MGTDKQLERCIDVYKRQVLTSYEFSEIEEEAKAAGVDAFIAKPLFRSRLTATLRQFTSVRKEKTRCV